MTKKRKDLNKFQKVVKFINSPKGKKFSWTEFNSQFSMSVYNDRTAEQNYLSQLVLTSYVARYARGSYKRLEKIPLDLTAAQLRREAYPKKPRSAFFEQAEADYIELNKLADVRCIDDVGMQVRGQLTKGKVYSVMASSDDGRFFRIINDSKKTQYYRSDRFVNVVDCGQTEFFEESGHQRVVMASPVLAAEYQPGTPPYRPPYDALGLVAAIKSDEEILELPKGINIQIKQYEKTSGIVLEPGSEMDRVLEDIIRPTLWSRIKTKVSILAFRLNEIFSRTGL